MKSKFVKMLSAVLVGVLVALLLGACGSGSSGQPASTPQDSGSSEPAGKQKSDLKIGIAVNGWTTNPVFIDMGNRLRKEAEADGIQLYEIPLSSAEDVTKACESFISSGCDGVIIQALYEDAVRAMIPQMLDAGIAVTIYDNDLSDAGTAYNALLNNYEVGYYLGSEAAKWANENIDGEVFAAVSTLSTFEIFRPRGQGIIDALNENLNNGSVVYTEDAAGNEQGIEFVENAHSAYPGLNLVVCWNGSSGVGSYEGLKTLGWNERDDVALFGCDASQDELAGILEGGCFKCTMDLDLQNMIYQLYSKTVDYCLNGNEYPEGTTDADKLWYFPATPVYIDTAADYVIEN